MEHLDSGMTKNALQPQDIYVKEELVSGEAISFESDMFIEDTLAYWQIFSSLNLGAILLPLKLVWQTFQIKNIQSNNTQKTNHGVLAPPLFCHKVEAALSFTGFF